MQDCLRNEKVEDPPLLPHLLERFKQGDKGLEVKSEQYLSDADDFAPKFNLNSQQAEALRATAGWLQDKSDEVRSLPLQCLSPDCFICFDCISSREDGLILI